MASTDTRGFCDLPPELLLQVARHISLRDHFRWLLADRRHKSRLTPILYLRIRPVETAENDWIRVGIIRTGVALRAIQRGLVGTLKNFDEIGDLVPLLGTCLDFTQSGHKFQAIHQAALSGHAPVVAYMLERGADVNTRTAKGFLPMHFAKTGEVVHLLSAHGGWLDRDGTLAGVPALTSSIFHGCRPSAVAAFLQLGADPHCVARGGQTAAEAAVERGNVESLGMLLDSDVEVRNPLPTGSSLLYKAVQFGGGDRGSGAQVAQTMATMLLDRGADPNSGLTSDKGELYQTPTLFLAVMMPSSADLVQLLLERGADQNMPYTRHRDRFYKMGTERLCGFEEVYADSLVANLVAAMIHSMPCVGDPPDPDAERMRKLQLLLAHGGDIDATIRDRTLLQYSLSQDGSRAERALEPALALVGHGADVTRVDAQGNATLHLLCGSLVLRVQEYWGPVVSMRKTTLQRPSPLAPLLTALVAGGADRNARDAQGRTPLMLLCKHAHTIPTAMLIRVLLSDGGGGGGGGGGVDVKAADKRGWNALHYATGEPPDPFDDEPCFRLQVLLSRDREGVVLGAAEVNAYSATGSTPLHLLLETRDRLTDGPAAQEKRRVLTKIRALTMLIRAGTDVRARRAGESPLQLALSQSNQLGIRLATRLLLQHGAAADVNYVSPSEGLTPLMTVAAAAGRRGLSRNTTEVLVRLLLAAGADPQMRAAGGRTAWDIFAEHHGLYPSIWPWALCFEGAVPEEEVALHRGCAQTRVVSGA